MARRAAPLLVLLASTLAACSGAPSPATDKPSAPALCEAAHLDACERKLTAPLIEGRSPAPELARAYASARAAGAAEDAWARVGRELSGPMDAGGKQPGTTVAIVVEGPIPEAVKKLGPAVRAISTGALPRPAAVSEDELLLALGGAAGYRHLIHLRAAGQPVTELFPDDPLAPFTAGLLPVVRDDQALDHLDDHLAMAQRIRTAFEAAAAYRYLDAAKEADALGAVADRGDPASEAVIRAREALQVLGNAGLVLDAENAAAAPPAPKSEPAAPTGKDTPYGDMLRVLQAKDGRKEWEARSASILRGIAPDRREALGALYVRSRDCQVAGKPPPMEGVRDLIFANKLAMSLIRDKATEAQGEAAGLLPLPAWLERYEREVELVDAAHIAWSLSPSVLLQRGEAFGLNPAGTATYRRVTEMGLSHLRASRTLMSEAPRRYRAFSQLGFAYNPGVLGDEALREALIKLTEGAVQAKLAEAHDTAGVFEGLLTGVFAGISYPPALQQAHFAALQGAFAAKLKGDLATATGWGAAGLFVLDAIYRVIADQGPRLDQSADQVARALGAADVPLPALAALATASARYAALAADHKLDPEVKKLDRFPPDRRAARDALRQALAGLGDPGEAPNNVLDDVTELSDGLIATLSQAVSPRAGGADKAPAKGAKGAPATCSGKSLLGLTPTTRRALGKLGDVRQRILSHPRFKNGDGRWVRRVRLLVTLLSDAMDLAMKENKRLKFTIPADEAEKNAVGALREWEAREAADAVAGLYALGRELASADSMQGLLKSHGTQIRRVVTGLIAYLRGDAGSAGGKGPLLGVALLDTLARLGLDKGGETNLEAMLVSYARAFYAQNQPDQADLWLLGTILISALTQEPPSADAIKLAAEQRSRIAWVLRFLAEVRRGKGGDPPDPALYADELRKATDDACQVPNAEGTLAVMGAIRSFSAGKRGEARAALDRVLEQADREGLGVPKMTYLYQEKTATRIFTVTLEVSYGAGVLDNANTFQLGLGMRTPGEPEGSLTASLAPLDSTKAGDEAARYYVHTAALATVYHLLDGDLDRATAAGRRVIGTLSDGVRLGPRVLRSDKPVGWGADARAIIAVAAVLAADRGSPFLAGDLWTVLRQGLNEEADDATVAALLDSLPLGLGAPGELGPVVDRARKALKILADPLPCTTAKVDLGGMEEPSCEAYPLAVSLRIADALKKLPRLRRGADTGPACAPLRSLDAFLASAEKGSYDPDAFTRAFEDLRASGRSYDAAALITRHRKDTHCSPAILGAARSLGRAPNLGPQLRADLLAVAINCAISGGGSEVDADLLAIDDETRKLPDPGRNLKVLLSVADLAVRTDQWGLLGKLAARPDLWDRWMTIHPTAAAATLLIGHATPVALGGAPDLEKTRSAYHLLCEIFPPGERADFCAEIKALRAPLTGMPAIRQHAAKEAVKKVVGAFSGQGRGP